MANFGRKGRKSKKVVKDFICQCKTTVDTSHHYIRGFSSLGKNCQCWQGDEYKKVGKFKALKVTFEGAKQLAHEYV
jgi:hypothetical protein